MLSRRLAYCLLLVLSASACTYGFTVDNKKYSSREDTVEATRARMEMVAEAASPVSERLGSRALIVIPTRTTFDARIRAASPGGSEEGTGFLVDVIEISSLAFSEGVRKGNVFDEVVVERNDEPGGAPFEDFEYKLWEFHDGTHDQWYLERKGSPGREPVHFDSAVGVRRMMDSFNKSIVHAAERLGATPVPASHPAE